jgi:hypothetical protein
MRFDKVSEIPARLKARETRRLGGKYPYAGMAVGDVYRIQGDRTAVTRARVAAYAYFRRAGWRRTIAQTRQGAEYVLYVERLADQGGRPPRDDHPIVIGLHRSPVLHDPDSSALYVNMRVGAVLTRAGLPGPLARAEAAAKETARRKGWALRCSISVDMYGTRTLRIERLS